MRFQPGLLSKAIVAASFAVVFAGCGGSGGGHDDPPAITTPGPTDPGPTDPGPTDPGPTDPVPVKLSGTAAAGAPIIGQVTVKDVHGTLRTVDIDTSGKYSVDVTDLVAPFLLRASGHVGGRQVTLVSAATSADIDGTINITPFTDLIVANIAGQVASSYFESANFSSLSTEQLNAAKTVLTQRLQPILASMGVADSFDLLRTSFNADHSGFDAVMDVVSVTVDAATNQAQIRNLISKEQITDNLASPDDDDALPEPPVGLAEKVGDLVAIEQVLAALTARFATGLPVVDDAFVSLFVDDGSFLDYGQNLETFLYDLSSDEEVIGASIMGARIVDIIAPDTWRIGFQVVHGGVAESSDWVMKKVDGVWKIAGDQRSLGQDITAVNARNLSGSFGWLETGESYQRYLEMYVDYAPVDVEYVVVSGPGIADAVVLHRSTQWQGFVVLNTNETETSSTWVSACDEPHSDLAPCINFAEVGPNSEYTFKPLDTNGEPISGKPAFTRILPAAPLTSAQASEGAASLFGSVASIMPANYSMLTDGQTITINLNLPPASGSVLGSVSYHTDSVHLETETLNANGSSVDLTWEGAAPTAIPSVNIWMRGDLNRRFVTLGRHNPSSIVAP